MKKLFFFLCALVCSVTMSAMDIYFVPNSNWLTANARFAAYSFEGSNTGVWQDMTAVEGMENTYKATIDEQQYPSIIFCRMNPETTENDWSNKWDQTSDLTVPTDGKNTYYYDEGSWSEGPGTWGVLGETPVEPTEKDTVFFVNSEGWETVKFYGYNGISTGGWPGLDMTKVEYQLKGADVYYYAAPVGSTGKCIFNCGSDDCKTGNLDWTAGKYYYNGNWWTRAELESTDPIPDVITYGIGSDKNDWDPSADPMTVVDGVATCTIQLEANATLLFSVVETKNGTSFWRKTKATITRDSQPIVLDLVNVDGNITLNADDEGAYLFTFVIETNTLSVTFPGTTGIVEASFESVATKVVRNGQLFIIREGVTYNAVGQVVE